MSNAGDLPHLFKCLQRQSRVQPLFDGLCPWVLNLQYLIPVKEINTNVTVKLQLNSNDMLWYWINFIRELRNIIFNFNQVTSDPDVRSSIQSSCACEDSPYLYPPAGHIVTGDITCIPDKELRSLFKEGPKYRLPIRMEFYLMPENCRGSTSWSDLL